MEEISARKWKRDVFSYADPVGDLRMIFKEGIGRILYLLADRRDNFKYNVVPTTIFVLPLLF